MNCKFRDFVPVFYARGFNQPYTEGHIQILRMMIKSLSSLKIRSLVLNYKYDEERANSEQDYSNYYFDKCEQKIPLIGREDAIAGQKTSVLFWSSIFEAFASLKFLSIEKSLVAKHPIVNITNCFRYPRLLAKKLLNVPVVVHFYMRETSGQMKSVMNSSDLFIVSSRAVADHLQHALDVPKEKIEVVYPPVDTEFFKPLNKEHARTILGIPREDKIILYIGNLNRLRFPETAVFQMMNSLTKTSQNVVLYITTPQTSMNKERALQIIRKARTLGLAHRLKIETRNLSDYEKNLGYNAADIFLFPSCEGAFAVEPPLTLLEAMSTGLPAVSNNILSVKELVEDGKTGYLVSTFSEPDLFRQKIDSLLYDVDLANEIGLDARKMILSNASIEVTGAKLCEMYENLLGD